MELCQFLPWDSAFFGERIARATIHRLNAETVKAIMAWCGTELIRCLYFLADSDDVKTLSLAKENGFDLVDIRVTLEHQTKDRRIGASTCRSEALHLRPSTLVDIPALQGIARTSHVDSRFFADGRFPVEKCEALYETWIKKSCEGYADVVFVAELSGKPAGYISCHLIQNTSRGQIGLIGVDPQARRYGLGSSLVKCSLDWFTKQGVDTVDVVTQGRNIGGQRLYQGCAFRTSAVQLWYHRWLP
jgi:ribosomal protein S18 acetylase RimI-like enzyme